jgi:hypothetical protein
MIKIFLVNVIVFGLCSVSLFAKIIASTSFENETATATYTDKGDAAENHDLVNNAGESLVDSTKESTSAGDLGFNAAFINTGENGGLTEGDDVGVTNLPSQVGAFSQGVQGYQFEDTDGVVVLNFDEIDITKHKSVSLSLDIFMVATTWEPSDWLHIYVLTDAGKQSILNTKDKDKDIDDITIDGKTIEGIWSTLKTKIVGDKASLVVEFESNSNNETMYIDNVVFETAK